MHLTCQHNLGPMLC